MAATKLNKVLQTNIPMLLTLKKFAGEYDDSFHPGEKTYLYIFTDINENEYSHYASPYQHDTALSAFKEGDTLQVLRTEAIDAAGKRQIRYQWTPPDDIQNNVPAQGLTNTAQRTMQKHQQEAQNQQEIKSEQISLQGYHQAHIAAGKTNREALQLALEARRMLIEETTALPF